MKICRGTLLVSYFVAAGAITAVAGPPPKNTDAKTALVARGEYLATRTAVCGDCHTPMNQRGELIKEKWLQGTVLFFKPLAPVPGWADKAPNIAGLPGWTDEQAIKFFMTGEAYNGLPASPPMPQFRFNRADATALVAYLRSLKPAPGADLKKDASKSAPQKAK